MSTTITPTTPAAWVPSLTWLQKHERLIIGTMVLVFALYGCNRWFDKSATDAKVQAAVAEQVAASADASKKQADATYAAVLSAATQQTALLQAQVASDKQTIASLVATVASRDAATTTKVNAVQGTKTPAQAVADLSTTYTLSAPVTVTDSGASVPTSDLQQFTVAKLEGDAAKADLKDTQSELSAAQSEVTNDENIIVQKDKVIAQDAVTLAAHDTAAQADAKKAAADLKEAKASARKSKWHWFWAGVATGWLGHEVAAAHGL